MPRQGRAGDFGRAPQWAADIDEVDEDWPTTRGLKAMTSAGDLSETIADILRGEIYARPASCWECALEDVEEAIELLKLAGSLSTRAAA
jgi:hypothetical protein